MLKTLMAEVDGKPVCAIVPSDREVSMKKLAAAFGGKSAQMMKPADAERADRLQGRRHQPVRPAAQGADRDRGDGRSRKSGCSSTPGSAGLQVRLDPKEAQRMLGAAGAAIVADAGR